MSKLATIGSQSITFTGIEKIIAVVDKTSGVDVVLNQITMDELHSITLRSEPPRQFAVNRIHDTSVEIYLDCIPTTTFTLYADAHVSLVTLAGNQTPDFPESYHDILIFGVMADEYRKMEKVQLYKDCEIAYEGRLSDLRMWIAKSGYMDKYQAKLANRSTTSVIGGAGGGKGSTVGTAALGKVLISQGVGILPIWSSEPLLDGVQFNLTTPATLVDGLIWVEVSGTTPSRVASLKFRDGGITRTIASITY